ncbi:MAG: hypothetical protein V1755_03785 [Chloroflexota bacterium]
MSFAILDYWALPIYYPTAWALRLVFGTAMLWLVVTTSSDFFRKNVFWLPDAWTFWAGLSVLLMIYIAQPQEAAYFFLRSPMTQ